MDYIFAGVVRFVRAGALLASYDIACQWSINLARRMSRIKPEREVSQGAETFKGFLRDTDGHATLLASKVKYVVPKFHLYAHKLACQVAFAFLWMVGAAATDGEGCERVWSGANPAAASLREMGPGSMQDTMDDMLGSWNWEKTCGLGERRHTFFASAWLTGLHQLIFSRSGWRGH